MTESPRTGSGGQSSVLCPDGLPVYGEILCPHNTEIQSSRLSIHIFQQVILESRGMGGWKYSSLLPRTDRVSCHGRLSLGRKIQLVRNVV